MHCLIVHRYLLNLLMGNSQQHHSEPPGRDRTDQAVIEANRFIQTVLQHNEELGFIPMRMLPDGNRAINRADMKKTRAIDLPFDVKDGTYRLLPSPGRSGYYGLSFVYNSSTPCKLTLYYAAKEKRSSDSLNVVEEIESTQSSFSTSLEVGSDQSFRQPFTIDVAALLALVESNPETAITPIEVIIERETPTTSRREISKLYLYFRISEPLPKDALSPIIPVLEKKGNQSN